MKRYDALYFLKEGFLGLWRNRVMSLASVLVLASCLVVMGSFAMLVANINSNIDALGELNEIRIFVDTDRDPDTEATPDTQPAEPVPESRELTCPQGVEQSDLPAMTEEEIRNGLRTLVAKSGELASFTDLNEALATSHTVTAELAQWQAQVYYYPAGEERDALTTFFFEAQDSISAETGRVFALSDLKAKVEGLGVRAELITKEQGFAQQKAKYAEFSELFASLSENPYSDCFRITYGSAEQADSLHYDLNHLDGRIYNVVYQAEVTDQIQSIRSVAVMIFTWFLAILFVISFFIIVNTVKLAVYARREEISVMYYIGATNFFITVPFVAEGLLIGLVSAIAAWIAQSGLYIFIMSRAEEFQIISVLPYASMRGWVLLGFLLIGTVTGVLGSIISLRRYMKA